MHRDAAAAADYDGNGDVDELSVLGARRIPWEINEWTQHRITQPCS
jgi:hypothetical protein